MKKIKDAFKEYLEYEELGWLTDDWAQVKAIFLVYVSFATLFFFVEKKEMIFYWVFTPAMFIMTTFFLVNLLTNNDSKKSFMIKAFELALVAVPYFFIKSILV